MGQKSESFWYGLSTRSEALFGSRTENWVSSQNDGVTELPLDEAEKRNLTSRIGMSAATNRGRHRWI